MEDLTWSGLRDGIMDEDIMEYLASKVSDSSETIPSWVECQRNGMTAKQAAQARGRTVSAARKAAKAEGFEFKPESYAKRRAPLRSNRYDQLKELLDDNLTLREIAGLLGVTPTAVWHACRARKIARPGNWRSIRGLTK